MVQQRLAAFSTKRKFLNGGFKRYIQAYEDDYMTPHHHEFRETEIFIPGEKIPLFFREEYLLQNELIEGTRVLDIGCNRGRLTLRLSQEGYQVTGLDCSSLALLAGVKDAKSLGQQPNFVRALAEHLPFQDNTFDSVIINETLEHVLDEHIVLAEVFRVARRVVLISVPEGYYYGDPLHLRHFTLRKLEKWLNKYTSKPLVVNIPSALKDFGNGSRILLAKAWKIQPVEDHQK